MRGRRPTERASGRRRAAPWSPSPGALPGRDSPPRTLIIGLTSVGRLEIMQIVVTGPLFRSPFGSCSSKTLRIVEAPCADAAARQEGGGGPLRRLFVVFLVVFGLFLCFLPFFPVSCFFIIIIIPLLSLLVSSSLFCSPGSSGSSDIIFTNLVIFNHHLGFSFFTFIIFSSS